MSADPTDVRVNASVVADGTEHGTPVRERALSRRGLVRGMLGAAVGLPLIPLLAACGGDDDDDDTTPTAASGNAATSTTAPAPAAATDTPADATPTTAAAEPTATTAAAPAATATTATDTASPTTAAGSGTGGDGVFPVTVSHKYGDTTIEAEPVRVVSLGYSDHDSILAVGVTPIAARFWFGDETNVVGPWAQPFLTGDAPEVLNFIELDFEAIAALRPDIIIAVYSGITETDYATLSQIAPTVAQSGDYIDYGMPWDETTLLIGAALGRSAEAEAAVAAVEQLYEDARTAHPEFVGATGIAAAGSSDGSVALFAGDDPRTQVMTALGFVIPDDILAMFGEKFYLPISPEQVNLLADLEMVVWTQVDYASPEAIRNNALYQQTKNYQEGRFVISQGDTDTAYNWATVLSLPATLDVLIPHIAAAIDGDPDTNEPDMPGTPVE